MRNTDQTGNNSSRLATSLQKNGSNGIKPHRFPLFFEVKNKIGQLALLGLHGLYSGNSNGHAWISSRPSWSLVQPTQLSRYNRAKQYTLWFLMVSGMAHLLNELKQENERRDRPNIFVPSYFYRAREDCYRYYQLSRLARNQEAFFSYYFYDERTVALLQPKQ